jgi:hypothetical protein
VRTARKPAQPAPRATVSDRVSEVALELVGGRANSASAAIYGTMLVTAIIAALSEDPQASLLEMASASLLTVVVFWLAHAYADVVGERATTRDRAQWQSPFTLLAHERPMVEAALIPTIPLLIGAIGGLHRLTVARASLAIGVVELSVWGYIAGQHLGSRRARLAGALFLSSLGIAITLLKLLVH